MNLRLIIIVIFISVAAGIGIFFFSNQKSKPAEQASQTPTTNTAKKQLPSTTPLPTHPPINKNSNLGDEATKLTTPDFSNDYESLKKEVDGSF